MTTAAEASPPLSADAAISAAVDVLRHQRGESVSDLAYHTRISIAALYRKLAGEAAWKAADVDAMAKHFGVQPGDLWRGPDITSTPPSGRDPRRAGADVTLRNLSSALRGPSRSATPRSALPSAA